MSEWKKYKLSEILNLVGGGTPKTTVAEYWDGDIPWLSVVDFGNDNKKVYTTEKTITEKGLSESSTKILKKGQIIISARGTVGELAVLGRDMAFNQSCYGIYANKKTENNFLYYLLKDSIGKIKKNTHGAVFDTITKQTFDNIEVAIPENIKEQKQIASILSSLDDKIELNQHMNQTLEAMAQAIFKEWFVDFKFPGFDRKLVNGLPKGWRKGTLGEIAQMSKTTISPSSKAKQVYFHYSLPAYDSGKIPLKDIGESILSNKFVVKSQSVLVSKLNPRFPRIWPILDVDESLCICSTEFLVFVPILKENYSFLYHYLLLPETIDTLIGLASGTSGSHQRIKPDDIMNLSIVIADKKTLSTFDALIKPFLYKSQENINENKTLTQLRDTLLPKLMTGQLEIKQS